jgi:hypothetical protein
VVRGLETLTENLRATARETMPQPSRQVLAQGQIVSTRPMPVDRAGVYAPGGRAAYPSSAVMALVPAQVAGVKEIAVCSPPGPDGLPSQAVLAACSLAGVEEVYAIGGAQAVAAMGSERRRSARGRWSARQRIRRGAKRPVRRGRHRVAGQAQRANRAGRRHLPPDVVAWDLAPGRARRRVQSVPWPLTTRCSRPCRPSCPHRHHA